MFVSYLFVLLIHDIGHIFFIKLFKVNITKIDIYPFGGIIHIENSYKNAYYKELLISVAGIIFQIILGLFLKDLELIKINYTIITSNPLPLAPLDGSKILNSILKLFLNKEHLIKANLLISIVLIFIILACQISSGNINIFFIVFITVMALKEYKKEVNNLIFKNIYNNIENYSVFTRF